MKFNFDDSLPRKEALEALCDAWKPNRATETVPLDKSFGRICAQDVLALYNLPVVRSSKMDGIGVHSADFANGIPDTSGWQRGKDYTQADTGDDFSDDFDAVVPIERVEYDEQGGIHLVDTEKLEGLQPGHGINESGSIVKAGSLVVPAYTRLTPELVAACAIGGHAQLKVLRRPKVAYLPTGSELIPAGAIPQRGQNIEANGLMIRGMLEGWGCECFCYPLTKDEPEKLDFVLDRALEWADIVIINGGSSRGEEDYNSQMLQARGSYFRHGVRAVPGRPVGMAVIDGKAVVNVPGPVLAAFLCMDWLLRGLVAHFNMIPVCERVRVKARLTQDFKKPKGFERLMRVSLQENEDGLFSCSPLSVNGVPSQISCADGMAVLPIGAEELHAGDLVEVELLKPIELIREAQAQ